MFRLISLFASAACLAAFVWFGLTVDLGDHTLFGHIRAISGTREAEQLVKGAKSKVTDLVGIEAAKHADRERERAKAGRGDMDDTKDPPGTAPAGPPQEELKAEDRAGMRKMIEAKKPVVRAPATKTPAARPASARPPAQGRVPPPSAGPNSRPPSKP